MDYSLTQLFVLKQTNTPPSSGTNWSSLSSQNFGVYKPDYTAATAGNVAGSKYIQLVQARPSTLPGVDHKRTDKIYLSNVTDWYKVSGGGYYAASLSCGTTSGSKTVTAASTSGIVIGQIVTGTGIPENTTVTSITTNTSITISNNATATGTTTLTFLNTQVTKIDLDASNLRCGEDYTISVRLRSFYIDTSFYNGLTRSYTYSGANNCCDCGDSPCDNLVGGDLETMMTWFANTINNDVEGRVPSGNSSDNPTNFLYSGKQGAGNFVIATPILDGTDSYLLITSKSLAAEPTTADRTNFPFQYDRIYFWAYAYKGPALSQDYIVADACDPFATITKLQNASYGVGSAAEIKQLEIDYNSFNTAPIAKQIFRNINFNQGVQDSEVTAAYYDTYVLKYKNPTNQPWNSIVPQDECAIICTPTGQNSGTIAILTAYLGTPVDKSI